MHTLCTTLDTVFRGRPITAIMGMMKDKDYVDCIRQLASRSRRFIGTSVDSPRALDPSVMATVAARACSDAYAVPQLEQAVAMALRDLEPNGILVIGGSVYLAGQALALLG
jgi:dihydrofolate synthase/folylpolyglutamate synthase